MFKSVNKESSAYLGGNGSRSSMGNLFSTTKEFPSIKSIEDYLFDNFAIIVNNIEKTSNQNILTIKYKGPAKLGSLVIDGGAHLEFTFVLEKYIAADVDLLND